MTTTLNFNLRHAIDTDDLLLQNDQSEIMQFILELDRAICETDFTMELIAKLQTSLEQDK